ncbi:MULTISPECIES: hypothetical protein [Winogradskyella]|uniref:hypothetical protein n=1 Tax=Winogradskyella TaxID=286104 RepID=UPI0015CACA4B|nr:MULTISPECIES: hypothetical protein [Winogradskyella]QXP78791.1 hypothetical protein H0I32_16540 [Winogradskyella sp. HaHa_3_26]
MLIIQNIIIPLVSALIGGLFSVWIFDKGLNKKKQEEKEKRIQNNFETEEYFFYNLESILYFIDCQVDAISQASKKTKNWYHKNLTLAIYSELKMTELREINFKTLFQILVIDRDGNNNEKMQDFINIKNCLHNIEDFVEKQKEDNKGPYAELIKYSDIWNNNLKNLTQLYNHYILSKPNKNDNLIPILKKYIIIEQRKIIANKDEQNMELFYQTIIFPLMNELTTIKNSEDQRILPILNSLMECRDSYEQTREIRYHRRKNIIESGRRLLKIKQLLSESLNSIKSRKKRIE